jgi:3-oxoacyl-[acyl-carrier-protein] synthase III
MRHARLIGTGAHLPEREVTNDDLARRMPEHAEALGKLAAATGIEKRWYVPDDWATSDLALPAARQALEDAGIAPEDLGLIVLGTDSPDYLTPATSTVLQEKLGAKNAGTFDVGCACASFPTGLAAASGLIAVNPSLGPVLVVGAYLMHRLADPGDPSVFFYGDGAGAAVLTGGDAPGFITSAMAADGSYHAYWGLYAGGTAEPASREAVDAGRTRVRFLERYPPEINHEGWPRLVRRLADQGGFGLGEVDLFVFTQVRRGSIELVMDDLGVPMERTHMIMGEQGYTGSACVPMALDDAIRRGKAGPGDLVVMVGSGVGYNQAGVALRL